MKSSIVVKSSSLNSLKSVRACAWRLTSWSGRRRNSTTASVVSSGNVVDAHLDHITHHITLASLKTPVPKVRCDKCGAKDFASKRAVSIHRRKCDGIQRTREERKQLSMERWKLAGNPPEVHTSIPTPPRTSAERRRSRSMSSVRREVSGRQVFGDSHNARAFWRLRPDSRAKCRVTQ